VKPPLKVSSTIEDSLIWDKVAMRFCWPFRQPWKLKDDSHHADRRDYELTANRAVRVARREPAATNRSNSYNGYLVNEHICETLPDV
jgi:hypothetical protein